MRISEETRKLIKESVLAVDPGAKIYLYGSRVDDSKKGGDIDILILSCLIKRKELGNIRWKILEQIGERKIDFLVTDKIRKPFERIAYESAVEL